MDPAPEAANNDFVASFGTGCAEAAPDGLSEELKKQYSRAPVRDLNNPAAINLNIQREFNLTDYLMKAALENFPDNIAFISKDRTVAFSKLSELINQAGNYLLRHKVSVEKRVVLMLSDSLNFIILFLGAIKIGAVPVALPHNFREHELRYLLDDTRAALAVTDPDFYQSIKNICQELPWKTEVTVSQPIASVGSSLQEELPECETELSPAATTADDSAFWLYTQGSSGFPKAAVHIHRSPLYVCRAYAEELLKINRSDVIFSTSSLFTNLGVMEKIFFPLFTGASAILYQGQTSEELLDSLHVHRPSLMFASPDIYADILEHTDEYLEYPLDNVRQCIASGRTLPLAVQAGWAKNFGLDILNGLSSTEELYIFISQRPDSIKAGSIGLPVPGYSIRIEDKDGLPSGTGQIGELLVCGGSTAKEFWNKRKKTARSILGNWLDTGDKCLIDDEGFCFFAGRRDDMFFINKQWVSPIDIERLLNELPQVEQAAVVSAVDESSKLKLRAFIVLAKNYEPSSETAKEIKIQYNARQPVHMQIKWIEFVPQLPKSINGKLQRYKLR
ncbi:benzoate-CoA ligase family protein [bacterium]|nr:benzoate-CoA ligase family protein [bacterium]